MAYEQYNNYGAAFQSDFFKVTNLSVIPVHASWNKALLSDDEIDAYEAYKTRPEYVGLSDEDRASRKKLPEAYKMRPFYEQLSRGVRFRVTDMVIVNKQPVTSVRYEYRFAIGPNLEEIKKVGSLGLARYLCDQHEIVYTREDTIDTICKKLYDKYGPNTIILTSRQWNESGLKNRERREIKMKIQPGESTPRITNEGYLVAEPMTDMEVEEWREKGEGYVPEAAATVEANKPNTEIEKLMAKMEELEKKLAESDKKTEEAVAKETKAVAANPKSNAKPKGKSA